MLPLHDDNPTHRKPLITIVVIALCILIYAWQTAVTSAEYFRLVSAFGVIPARLFGQLPSYRDPDVVPAITTLFTSMFLHGGFTHLAGNMLYLWIFGNNVEDAMGHTRFTLFYLLCGIIAALGHVALNQQSFVPMVGASGAISGVLGAYLLLYPRARIHVLVPTGVFLRAIPVPAAWVLLFWFAFQLLASIVTAGNEGGTAWFAHVSGFVAGMLFVALFTRRDISLFNKDQ